jgi:thiamine-monophosphate kinase
MSSESDFIATLRAIIRDPAARGLTDDAAVLEVGGTTLVLTHDMIVEGVHFLSSDPPEDVAWKLVAVNLSDLAGKGAKPVGLLMGYTLGEEVWNRRFARGFAEAARAFEAPLLGGDTVSVLAGGRRVFGLTAIGRTEGAVPSRAGARAGDTLWVSGTIGDAGAGLRAALGEIEGSADLVGRYRRPVPRLALGQALAPLASAMMDVSDGLLIDAARMAEASGLALQIDLEAVPLSADYIAACGDTERARVDAAVAGDDYELLLALAKDAGEAAREAAAKTGLRVTKIGAFEAGRGIRLLGGGGSEVPVPDSLGWEHGTDRS